MDNKKLLSGASTLASLIPGVGGILSAGLGMGADYFAEEEMKKKLEEEKRQQKDAQAAHAAFANMTNANMAVSNNQATPMLFGNGGSLTGIPALDQLFKMAAGGNISDVIGQTHEKGGSPYAGVELEKGEKLYNENFVFSDRIKPHQGKKTFAELAGAVQQRYKKFKDDPVEMRQMSMELDELAHVQEATKLARGMQNIEQAPQQEQVKQMWDGGTLSDIFTRANRAEDVNKQEWLGLNTLTRKTQGIQDAFKEINDGSVGNTGFANLNDFIKSANANIELRKTAYTNPIDAVFPEAALEDVTGGRRNINPLGNQLNTNDGTYNATGRNLLQEQFQKSLNTRPDTGLLDKPSLLNDWRVAKTQAAPDFGQVIFPNKHEENNTIFNNAGATDKNLWTSVVADKEVPAAQAELIKKVIADKQANAGKEDPADPAGENGWLKDWTKNFVKNNGSDLWKLGALNLGNAFNIKRSFDAEAEKYGHIDFKEALVEPTKVDFDLIDPERSIAESQKVFGANQYNIARNAGGQGSFLANSLANAQLSASHVSDVVNNANAANVNITNEERKHNAQTALQNSDNILKATIYNSEQDNKSIEATAANWAMASNMREDGLQGVSEVLNTLIQDNDTDKRNDMLRNVINQTDWTDSQKAAFEKSLSTITGIEETAEAKNKAEKERIRQARVAARKARQAANANNTAS